jgi:hypothetical protein
LGRRPKNKFEDATLVFQEGLKIKRYDVKMPFLYDVTVQINDPDYAKAHTRREYFVGENSNLDELVKEIESDQSFRVIKVEPAVRQFIDLCPRCHKSGVPKIEKKNVSDNRERSWRNKDEEKAPLPKEREPEFWFTYTHSKMKKCRICQYENYPTPAYKHNTINIEQYFYPQVIGNMKRGFVKFSDQEEEEQ